MFSGGIDLDVIPRAGEYVTVRNDSGELLTGRVTAVEHCLAEDVESGLQLEPLLIRASFCKRPTVTEPWLRRLLNFGGDAVAALVVCGGAVVVFGGACWLLVEGAALLLRALSRR